MIRNLMALPCLLALVLACGQGRTDGQDTGAAAGTGSESGALPADTGFAGGGIEDTTADTAVPSADTAAPAGEATSGSDTAAPSSEADTSDTTSTSGPGATSDTTH